MYLDTSVVVKLYTREADSAKCEQLVTGHKIVSSELLYTEFWSALLAKERNGSLNPSDRQRTWELFEMHLLDDVIELADLDGAVVREAAELMARVHPRVPLRTLDAIHLATFANFEAGVLFTCDRRMLEAARMLSFPVVQG